MTLNSILESDIEEVCADGVDDVTAREAEYHRELFVDKLLEAGVSVDRGVPLRNGEKRPSIQNDPQNNTVDLRDAPLNCGVTAGDGLLISDLDVYEAPIPDSLREFHRGRPTLQSRTPHVGGHEIYTCPPETEELFKEEFGVRNPGGQFGEVQTGGKHVVAPGASINHLNCPSSKPNCPGRGTDVYKLTNERDIYHLTLDDVHRLIEVLSELRGRESTVATDLDCTAIQHAMGAHERAWLTCAREMDDKLDRLCTWAEEGGEPDKYDLEYPDRSSNEVALAEKLLWQYGVAGDFKKPRIVVIGVLDHLQPPKWSQAGETYRKSVMQAASDHAFGDEEDFGGEYVGKTVREECGIEATEVESDSTTSRGVLRKRADKISLVVRYNMEETFTTKEVAALLDTSESSVRRVLNAWREYGILSLKGSTSDRYWQKNDELPTGTSMYEKFLKENFQDDGTVRQIQHAHLRRD